MRPINDFNSALSHLNGTTIAGLSNVVAIYDVPRAVAKLNPDLVQMTYKPSTVIHSSAELGDYLRKKAIAHANRELKNRGKTVMKTW